MTEQQIAAFNHPTLLAEETAHPRFGEVMRGLCSIIVTINAGYE